LRSWNNRLVRSRLLIAALAGLALLGAAAAVVVLGDGGAKEDLVGTTPPSASAGEGGAASGGAAAQRLRLKRIGRFDGPLYVTSPPGDRRRTFVVEQAGRIRVMVNGKRARRPFLDISGLVKSGGEQGLLSMAFAPDYARTRRFYVDFTDRNGDTRVQELRRSRRSPNRAIRSSRRQVLFVDQPFDNHNGGLLLFGPDGYLYIGMGDGGSAGDPSNNAQNLDSLLGKILRIDPRRSGSRAYSVPRSNPFVGRGGRDEIYAYGLRNPWRFSFDDKTGDLYIGDVGQSQYEEIDYAKRGQAVGRNYGWRCFEGDHRYRGSQSCPGAVGPVLEYSHGGGGCSVTGGVVVRDPALPGLAGRYLYGDYCAGRLRSFKIAGGQATGDGSLGLTVPSLSSFGEDARRHVYATSGSGPVYRLLER
jgi:glucose/arabinose dehydrogenase